MSPFQVKHLQYQFHSPQPTPVLRDVSFGLDKGEFVSIVGPSGAGKSTILKLMADLLPLQGGTVTLQKHLPQEARIRREFAYVFQTPALLPWRSIRRNLELPLQISNQAIAPAKIEQLLQLTGLSGFQEHKPSELSGGMQQLAAIARALVLEPELLLLDEPFSALDAVTREKMNTELERIVSSTHKTALLVTHSIEEAVYLSDRVLVLSARPGQIGGEVVIDEARPRSASWRKTKAFFDKAVAVRELLERESATWRDIAVVSGEGRGRTMGFPTLNLNVEKLPLPYGVHAAWVKIDGQLYPSALHYGPKSTFGGHQDTVEAFVMDYEEKAKTKMVDFEVVGFVRSTVKFVSKEALVAQMEKDVARTREMLGEGMSRLG